MVSYVLDFKYIEEREHYSLRHHLRTIFNDLSIKASLIYCNLFKTLLINTSRISYVVFHTISCPSDVFSQIQLLSTPTKHCVLFLKYFGPIILVSATIHQSLSEPQGTHPYRTCVGFSSSTSMLKLYMSLTFSRLVNSIIEKIFLYVKLSYYI